MRISSQHEHVCLNKFDYKMWLKEALSLYIYICGKGIQLDEQKIGYFPAFYFITINGSIFDIKKNGLNSINQVWRVQCGGEIIFVEVRRIWNSILMDPIKYNVQIHRKKWWNYPDLFCKCSWLLSSERNSNNWLAGWRAKKKPAELMSIIEN